ncbi:MAG: CoB--CoM heterodisulfide reductase iron-sulfur subunit B family protein [Thermodesulfobacteriota bacterium]
MKDVSYYPGCSLEGTARDYRESIHAVCQGLGIGLEELPDWNCCGASSAHSINHKAAIALSERNLIIAERVGRDMVVPCPLCYNRLKTAEKARAHIKGRIKIWDLADYMGRDEILAEIESKVTRPLSGLKAVCYYGCMSSRPPRVTDVADCENPMSMDNILERLGVEVIPWSHKTDCCGASHAIDRPDLVFDLVGKLYKRAIQSGANCIAVSCQMCQANLDMYQDRISHARKTAYYLPVLYFTELVGLAMGHGDAGTWFARHFVDPARLLNEAGIAA